MTRRLLSSEIDKTGGMRHTVGAKQVRPMPRHWNFDSDSPRASARCASHLLGLVCQLRLHCLLCARGASRGLLVPRCEPCVVARCIGSPMGPHSEKNCSASTCTDESLGTPRSRGAASRRTLGTERSIPPLAEVLLRAAPPLLPRACCCLALATRDCCCLVPAAARARCCLVLLPRACCCLVLLPCRFVLLPCTLLSSRRLRSPLLAPMFVFHFPWAGPPPRRAADRRGHLQEHILLAPWERRSAEARCERAEPRCQRRRGPEPHAAFVRDCPSRLSLRPVIRPNLFVLPQTFSTATLLTR